MPILIKKLNQTLRGWGNYHRHVAASEAFSRIDT
jgi:RNA-directed DNA polymerase